ncbi:MAG: hypothetical protein HKN40_13205 [Winogradskyella sp.]|uniref:hypothetical protein n=1 Tax=Winogradskyella sp. TaxID=1883156 RepID=UPI00184A80DD|nr:hypothetical protein [Winogradskyella sp.]
MQLNEASSSQVGFSRVVTPATMNGGFSRLDYQLNGDMQGKTGRKIKRWFRRNAPFSYIAAALGGILIVDAATGGAVKEIVFPKKRKRR